MVIWRNSSQKEKKLLIRKGTHAFCLARFAAPVAKFRFTDRILKIKIILIQVNAGSYYNAGSYALPNHRV